MRDFDLRMKNGPYDDEELEKKELTQSEEDGKIKEDSERD